MSKDINAIIVDDELFNRELLRNLLLSYSSRIAVLKDFDNLITAVEYIKDHKVDVIFLDIEMPKHNGLELFELCASNEFDVVIVSAYDQYAIPAIKEGVFDYLLKPIEIKELKNTLAKLQSKYDQSGSELTLKLIVDKVITNRPFNDIIAIMAEGSYCKYILTDGNTIIQSRNLAYTLNNIENSIFIKVHRSVAVNPNHIVGVNKSDLLLELTGGVQVKYSRQGRKLLTGYFDH